MSDYMSPQELSHYLKELIVALRSQTNQNGVMQVEPILKVGRVGESDATICSHDFSDPTTWYQFSEHHQAVSPTTDDRIVFDLGRKLIINIDSPKLFARDYALFERDGSLSGREKYRLFVTVGGNKVLQNDVDYPWSIDWLEGKVTFEERVPNDKEVLVDFWANPDSGGSRFVLRPNANKTYMVEHVEVQFSEETSIEDNICFEAWGGAPAGYQAMYLDPSYRNSVMNPWRQVYRSAHDFINNCNEGQGVIQPFGGNSERGIQKPVIVFPFRYLRAFTIQSRLNSEFHVYLENDKPYKNSEIVTCAFYTVTVDEEIADEE